jgi:hypothetical protein
MGGGTVGSIPWSKATEYARLQGLEGDMLGAFWAVIRCMDSGYHAWMSSEHQRHVRRDAEKPGSGDRTRQRRGKQP